MSQGYTMTSSRVLKRKIFAPCLKKTRWLHFKSFPSWWCHRVTPWHHQKCHVPRSPKYLFNCKTFPDLVDHFSDRDVIFHHHKISNSESRNWNLFKNFFSHLFDVVILAKGEEEGVGVRFREKCRAFCLVGASNVWADKVADKAAESVSSCRGFITITRNRGEDSPPPPSWVVHFSRGKNRSPGDYCAAAHNRSRAIYTRLLHTMPRPRWLSIDSPMGPPFPPSPPLVCTWRH